jgi:hypothetical protein
MIMMMILWHWVLYWDQSGRSVKLVMHPKLVPKSKARGGVLPAPAWAYFSMKRSFDQEPISLLSPIFAQSPSGHQNAVMFRAAANCFTSSYDNCQERAGYRVTEVGCEPATANRVGIETRDTAPAHSCVT